MNNKSKTFFSIFFVCIMAVFMVSFYKYYIQRDYDISAEAYCDPAKEECFVLDEDGQISYYKIIDKKASGISLTESGGLSCNDGEDCEVTYCSEDTKVEGEECSTPEQYLDEQKSNSADNGADAADIESGSDD